MVNKVFTEYFYTSYSPEWIVVGKVEIKAMRRPTIIRRKHYDSIVQDTFFSQSFCQVSNWLI